MDKSPENYPPHLVLSLRSFWVYTRRSLPLSKPNPSSKQPRTADMASPRKNVSQATAAAPASSKGKGKNRWSRWACKSSPQSIRHPHHLCWRFPVFFRLTTEVLVVAPEPRHTNEQLFQTLSNQQNQVEEQQTYMGRLREVAALEKDTVTRVQPDSSSRSTYCENHSPPELVKKELRLPCNAPIL